MRRLWISLLLLGTGAAANAQLGVWASYTMASVKYGSFDQFVASYNKVNGPGMKDEMPGFGMSSGFSAGMNVRARFFYADLSEDVLNGKTFAEFTNGEKREFDLHEYLTSCGMGFGYGSKNFYLYIIGGLAAGDVQLNSSFIYNDGTRSYGLEKTLNSKNHGIALGGYYGITSCIPVIRHVKVMLRASHFGFSPYDSKYGLDDLNSGRSLNVYSGPYPDGIPTDYESYLSQGYSYEGSYVGTDIRNWRFFIGLVIELTDMGLYD
jgi:hypothetical protein